MKRALIAVAAVGILAPAAWVTEGERTIWRPGSGLQRWPSLWPFANVCPFSQICPPRLPPLCPCPATVWQ